MDTLEQVVARRLGSLDADRRAVPEVLERALRAGERRRRRRRVLGGVASGAGTLAVALAAVVVGGGGGGQEGPVDLPAPVPLQDSTLRTELAVLLGSTTADVVPRERGWYDFRAYDLAADGTLFGAEQHYDRSWFDTWGEAQTADVQTGRIDSYQVGDVAPMVGGDGQTRLTLEHEDPQHKFDLFCTPRVGGTRTQLSDASVAESSVRIDDGHVVWSTYPQGDEPYRVWTAEGCAGEPLQLEVSGLVRAVSWPDVYLSVPDEPWLVRVDATTGERTDYALPDGLSERDLPGAIAEKRGGRRRRRRLGRRLDGRRSSRRRGRGVRSWRRRGRRPAGGLWEQRLGRPGHGRRPVRRVVDDAGGRRPVELAGSAARGGDRPQRHGRRRGLGRGALGGVAGAGRLPGRPHRLSPTTLGTRAGSGRRPRV